MTDKEKIRAEIKRQYEEYLDRDGVVSAEKADALHCILSFIDSLQEEPVSDDLEEELNKWRHNHFKGRRDKDASGEYLERISQLDLARHFANWQKQQLMKDALDGEVIEEQVGRTGRELRLSAYIPYELGFKDGDKVKQIIIKED